LDKAGAYGIQDYGEMIIEGIKGSLSNVIGLPVEELMEQLSKLGS
jgi:septum formation protein